MEPANILPPELLHCRLSQARITDPYIGLEKFFDGAGINDIREELNRLKETLLSESFGECDPNDKYMILYFFSRLEILFESCYMLHKAKKTAHKK